MVGDGVAAVRHSPGSVLACCADAHLACGVVLGTECGGLGYEDGVAPGVNQSVDPCVLVEVACGAVSPGGPACEVERGGRHGLPVGIMGLPGGTIDLEGGSIF